MTSFCWNVLLLVDNEFQRPGQAGPGEEASETRRKQMLGTNPSTINHQPVAASESTPSSPLFTTPTRQPRLANMLPT